MKTYLLNLWDAARASYWFVPSLFVLGAVSLSLIAPWLDGVAKDSGKSLPDWVSTTTNAARATLSALAGAMVAVTGTVFSITIVTLSLTSQQFGPRLLRRFMYDLPTQMTLGVFLGTGIYCLLLLRVVESREDGLVAPHLAVLLAVVLAVLSMVMLIVFIHHIAMLIQAPQIVAAVARDLDDAILRLFPEKIGEMPDHRHSKERTAADQAARLGDDYVVLHSTHEGYMQAMDGDGLMHLSEENDLVLKLCARPGSFIEIGTPLAKVWSDSNASDDDIETWATLLNEMIIVGVRRTPRQDVECAIDELVEVAVRSLSPGINDPFTAINCISRLGAAVGRLAERRPPSPHRCNDEGRLRVIGRPVSFRDVLDSAFNQIRQYGRDSVAVTSRLLEVLASIADRVQRDEDRQAVHLHAKMVARCGEFFQEVQDREQVARRLREIVA